MLFRYSKDVKEKEILKKIEDLNNDTKCFWYTSSTTFASSN